MTQLESVVCALNTMNMKYREENAEGDTFIYVENGDCVTTRYTFSRAGQLYDTKIETHGPAPMDRDEVYEAINSERDYQERRWGYRQPKGLFTEAQHAVGNWLTFMRYYLNQADEALTTNTGDEAALDMIRKVVALGVACHEQHGCKSRDPNVLVTNGRDGKRA